MTEQEEIAFWKGKFRVLVGWEIEFDGDGEYKGQACVSPKEQRATIYGWGSAERPADYIFHEVLHVAFRAAKRIPRTHGAEGGEEWFVQDLCVLFMPLLMPDILHR
jgi:hypothetical protein